MVSTTKCDAGPSPVWKKAWTIIGLGVFLAGVALLVATGNTTVPVTRGSDGSTFPLLGSLIPVALGLLLVRLLPWRLTTPDVLAGKNRAQISRELITALGIAVAFPLLLFGAVRLGVNAGLWSPVLKTVLFVVVSGLLLRRFGGGELGLRDRPWLWPAVVSGLYLIPLNTGPLAPAFRLPAEYLVPSALPFLLAFSFATNFVGAGLAEEVFYRALLQTRLEILLGRWGGILLASVFFALMHLPTRYADLWRGQTGSAPLDFALALAAVVAFQGSFGVFAGYLWSRYRNLGVNVLMHTGVNVVPVVLLAAGTVY